MSDGTLIVGASQAGLQLAATLRRLGDDAPITLVGEEPHPPYQRPPLSKDFLLGTADLDSLAFRTPAYYAEAGIDLVCGERISRLRLPTPADRSTPAQLGPHTALGPGTAVTASGRALRFDRLALTVGAAPRRLTAPGAELADIRYLRDRDDAAQLRRRLLTASRIVVVGGGFIGLEAAAAAVMLGKSVTVVEAAERLMARAVAPVVSDFYRRAHERRGAAVLLSAAVSGFEGTDGRVTGVRLADGTLLPADLVMVGVGVVPRTELAEQLGLDCDGGIVVDARGRTSDPRVVAAGDCTVQPHPLTGEGLVRLESVQNAVAQATAAAASLLARGEPDQDTMTTAGAGTGTGHRTRTGSGSGTVPWFWSFQGDLKLQIAGLSTGYDRVVLRGEPEDERFSVLYYRADRLLAIDAVNSPAEYMAVRKALSQGATIPPERAGNADTPLKSLIDTHPDAMAQAA